MKKTIIVCAIGAMGFLAQVAVANPAAEAPVGQTATAAKTLNVFVVETKGGGWGAAKSARAAVASQKGVSKIMMSGQTAYVFMEDGADLSRTLVTKSVKSKGLRLSGFEKKEIPQPKAGFSYAASGLGWAQTNDKARVALEKMDGVVVAFVGKGIQVYLDKDVDLAQADVAKALKRYKINVKSSEKMESLPF